MPARASKMKRAGIARIAAKIKKPGKLLQMKPAKVC